MDEGSGFTALADDLHHTGSASKNLQLVNIPSSWYGRRYRCTVDGDIGSVSTIQIWNVWTGSVDNNWSNPANWSCNAVPDANTDVFIHQGQVTLSSSTTVRTLSINSNVTFTLGSGAILTIRL